MNECEVTLDLGNGWDYLDCSREVGHEGIHRSDAFGIYWHPTAPPLDVIEVPEVRTMDPALGQVVGRLRGGIEL